MAQVTQSSGRCSLQFQTSAEDSISTLFFSHLEADRDTSGSPNIALKDLEKIEEAAIVVADITAAEIFTSDLTEVILLRTVTEDALLLLSGVDTP